MATWWQVTQWRAGDLNLAASELGVSAAAWRRHSETAGRSVPVRLAQTHAKLDALNTVETILATGGRQLLVLVITHERAQAAIAVGDIDHASHVGVFTPGLTSTVNGMGTYDRDKSDLLDRSTRLLANNPSG